MGSCYEVRAGGEDINMLGKMARAISQALWVRVYGEKWGLDAIEPHRINQM